MFAIGQVRVFRLGGWSPHVQTGFHVSRPTRVFYPHFRIRGCHPLWPLFPKCSANLDRSTGLVRVRSPLLTESRLMSFPPGTEMFQFPGFASPRLFYSPRRYLIHLTHRPPDRKPITRTTREMVKVGFPIRKSPDQSLLTTPRRLSQRATSFIACTCQGIHQMLLPHA